MRIVLIGAGNMGEAIVRGALANAVVVPSEIGVVEVSQRRREAVSKYGCRVVDQVNKLIDHVQEFTHVMLAVKPQAFASVAQSMLDAGLTSSRVFISIMAGLDSGRIHRAIGPGARIIRCMPNTPCQIGSGMTAICPGMGAREGDELFAIQLFEAIGATVYLEDELLMDAVTAVSGSGPAYVFLLAEAMQMAAEDIGLPPVVAETLVSHTIAGAGAMLTRGEGRAKALRAAVTSPGGTTAAALSVFEREGLVSIVREAIRAARDRGRELGGN